MEKVKEGVYTAKTVEEAINTGLLALELTREQAEIEVLEEGKKGFFIFGGTPARVKISQKLSDGERAVKFLDGLLEILNKPAVCELVNDGEKIEIEIKTTNSHAIIGRRGEVLDAMQCIAGAVANIGNEDYKRVVVDCENYREQREETLKKLANNLAKKAVEKGKKVTLEPMNPYERRIIHSALAENTEVKTISDGKEPNRFIVIIPNNLKHYDKRDKNGKRPFDKRDKFEKHGDKKERGERKGNRPSAPRSSAPKRGKKQITFGTFLGNSGNKAEE
ncbi:MAG: protein jag [Clostridiales bacterium]|nr:protein jag [Clostridiales bacterium]